MRELSRGCPVMEPLESRQLLSVVLSEGFELGFPTANGWTVSASQGRTWDDVSRTAKAPVHSGSFSGYGSFSTPGIYTYADNMNSYMEKTISLAGYAGRHVLLDFNYWVHSEYNFDFLRVSLNGSTVWSDSGDNAFWLHKYISLDAYAGGSVTVRFSFVSNGSNSARTPAGAWLDDIHVVATPASVGTITQDVGTLAKDKPMMTGIVSSGTRKETCKFYVEGTHNTALSLKFSGGDANLTLYDDSGAVVATSSNVGSKAESIRVSLTSGAYYATVSWVSGNTVFYGLSLK